MKLHYIYKITNLNPTDSRKYYIGVRSTNHKSPEDDSKYMSSSNYLLEHIQELGFSSFSKEILSTWETRELANAEEVRLHTLYNVSANPEYYNMANATSSGFCTFEQITVLDIRDNSTKNVSKEDFEKYDYYVSIVKGTVCVLDTRDNSKKRVTLDEFNNHEYYEHILKGRVTIIDKNGKIRNVSQHEYNVSTEFKTVCSGKVNATDVRTGKTIQVSQEDFYNFDYYQSHAKGMLPAKDTRDNSITYVSTEEFNKCDYYTGIRKGMIYVKDTRDNSKVNVTCDEFKNNPYLEGLTTGLVPAFDISTNTTKLVSKDIFDKNDNLVGCTKGKVQVIDTRDNSTKLVSRKDFKKYDYYISTTFGKVTAIDTRDGKTKHVSKDDFKKYDYFVSINSKKIEVYTNEGILFGTSYGNFSKFCKQHNLAFEMLRQSYCNNGSPIYQNINKFILNKITKIKRDFQIGWYAIEVK